MQPAVNPLSFCRELGLVILVIDSPQTVADLLPKVKAAEWIAIDTEADSLHAYPEKLCLLQISAPGIDVLVDPLAGLDLKPLLHLFQGKELLLHGADYDLRLLRRTFDFVPHAVFDTMWAARLLGHQEFGLRALVHQHLGVALEKGPQKMNWALRPLPERMATYALNDTRFLRPLAELLRAELLAKGRLDWLMEVCARVVEESSSPRQIDPETLWRIKGSDRLDRRAMAILRELWLWREEEALAANKPPYFIMSHEKLVALALAVARGRPTRSVVPEALSVKRAARLASAVGRGLDVPPSAYPQVRRLVVVRLTKDQQQRFDELKRLRDNRALELGLDPTVIASKGDLISLARNGGTSQSEVMNWQRRLLGLS